TTHAVSYGDVNTVGSVSGSVTITGEAPTTGSGTVALSGRVYDHANAALSVTSGNNQRVIKGTANITAGLTLTNIGGDNAPADVANLSIGLSGPTGSGTVAADGSVAYTAALDTVTSGRGQSQSFDLHAGDQEILPGHDSLALLNATVTVDVLDHANGTFANVVGAVGTPSGGGKVLSLDFGTVTVGTGGGNLDATFDVFANVVGAATANLVLTGITGDITKLSGETSFTNLAAGDVKGYTFHFSTAVAGTFNAAYTFNLFDEAGVLGGTGDTLTLEVTGIVSEAPALHPGDVNGDGIVNFLDYNIVKTNYLSNGVGWAGGDLNGDGVVNFLDYNIVKTHYLHTNAANGSGVMAVPEPATFLCLFGVVPILTGRKRRAKA
ncbi:MAG: dockerin type I domain-containing protein, partial [Planctomycetota bacterium]